MSPKASAQKPLAARVQPAGQPFGFLLGPTTARIDRWLARFPDDAEGRRSAVLSALREAQHQSGGHLTPRLIDDVADYIGMARIDAYEVASFYSMLETGQVGRCCISLCTNLSCMLRGADDIQAHLERRLGIRTGGSTADGRFFLKREEECLAACCNAPAMQADHRYYTDLTEERVDEVLTSLGAGPFSD